MDIRQNPYRADFPLLADHPEIAFLDSAATAQRPACALDAQRNFYETMNANPLRGLYSLSVAATAAIADVRAQVAALIGAPDARDVVFTRNTSSTTPTSSRGRRPAARPGHVSSTSIPRRTARSRTRRLPRRSGRAPRSSLPRTSPTSWAASCPFESWRTPRTPWAP